MGVIGYPMGTSSDGESLISVGARDHFYDHYMPPMPPTFGRISCCRAVGGIGGFRLCNSVHCREDCCTAFLSRAIMVLECPCIDQKAIQDGLKRIAIIRITADDKYTRRNAIGYLKYWDEQGKHFRLWLCGNCDLLCVRRGGAKGRRGTKAETKRRRK